MTTDFEEGFFETHRSFATLKMNPAPGEMKERLDEVRGILKRKPVPEKGDHFFIREPDKETWFQLRNPTRIGRHKSNEIVLNSPLISSRHCILKKVKNGWILEDLNSSNGVRVNNSKKSIHMMVDGDVIQFSQIKLFFISDAKGKMEDLDSRVSISKGNQLNES